MSDPNLEQRILALEQNATRLNAEQANYCINSASMFGTLSKCFLVLREENLATIKTISKIVDIVCEGETCESTKQTLRVLERESFKVDQSLAALDDVISKLPPSKNLPGPDTPPGETPAS
jgi:hypothetical protein